MFRIGQELKSYCNGYFGSDFYGGRIEAIGFDWVVARSAGGNHPCLAYFAGGIDEYASWIETWNEYEHEDEDA
jgi:hypothetical protein